MSRYDSITRLANLLFPCFLIITIGIICYSGSFDASFTFDDIPSIINNESIKDLWDLKTILEANETRFLAFFSFAVNYHIHGLNLFGYHLVNLIIHILTALTLYWLVRVLFLTPEMKETPISQHAESIALVVSLVFVSHPVETQAVTYIVQRMTSMVALFYLLSLVLYIKARIHYDERNSRHIPFYVGSITAALLAMFTKEISVTLPLCIIVCEYFFFSPSLKKIGRKLSYLWPMLFTLPVVPLTYILTKKEMMERVGLATMMVETDSISRLDYLLTQFNVISTYIRLLFLPIHQSIDYDYPLADHFFEPATFASFLLLLFIFVLALLVFKKFRLVSFGIIWFYLALMVESSVIPIRDVIFEHRLYLPSVGIFLSSTVLLFHLLGHRRKILFALFAVVISLASVATINRNIVWKNAALLWNDAVAKGNIKARTMNNLGVGLINLGRVDLAISHYDKAQKQFPRHAKIYFNRGMAHHMVGNIKKAMLDYTKSIEIYPKYHRTYFYRGMALIQLGQPEKALEDLNHSIRISPNDSNVYYNRSSLYLFQGRYKKALEDAHKAIELEKHKPLYYRNRALIFYRLKMYEEALEDLDMAIQLNPKFTNAYALRDKIFEQWNYYSHKGTKAQKKK